MKNSIKKTMTTSLLLMATMATTFANILYQADVATIKNGEFHIRYYSQYEGGIELLTKLIFDDGSTYSGIKFDYPSQRYAIEKFEARFFNGEQALSFCSDFGSVSIEGRYEFDPTGRKITAKQKELLIAAFDYINDLYGLESLTDGRLLGQLIVWNVLLGNTGYPMPAVPPAGKTLMKFEGADYWYTAKFASIIDGILNGSIDVVSIYNEKLQQNADMVYICDILCIEGSGKDYYWQQRQIIPVYNTKAKDCNCPTVNLVHFSAVKRSDREAIQVTWATDLEIDNASFVLYRSLNGEDFAEVASIHNINGEENNGIHNYEFYDEDYNTLVFDELSFTYQAAPATAIYYRLHHDCHTNNTSVYLDETSISGMFLPVELVEFSVKPTPAGAFVTWATQSESNNDYFTIQRSSNGIDFEDMVRINGAGTSAATINYGFTDTKPLNGISYYRLKQTDFDSQYSYSSVQSVLFNAPMQKFDIFKSSKTKLSVHFSEVETANRITIYTTEGELIFDQSVPAGYHIYNIEKELRTGVYVVNNEYKGSTQSKKVKI